MNNDANTTPSPRPDQWVFVIVQDHEKNPQIAGQHDTAADVAYIAAYGSREDAQQGLLHLTLPKSARYEIHAFMFDDLCAQARAGGFLVYLVDAQGVIMKKMTP